ncbi:hypothetical protein AVEN_270691-1 [Araneus ventricosus]|uniref:Uncharacterized protein n=1 Tax=Araneus ventricosus TaxID=182803 RepID=A0A4Y2FV36_ARAVE|nr:hypothetical protein AVEN_270691-1 [Araneus ventricosus]
MSPCLGFGIAGLQLEDSVPPKIHHVTMVRLGFGIGRWRLGDSIPSKIHYVYRIWHFLVLGLEDREFSTPFHQENTIYVGLISLGFKLEDGGSDIRFQRRRNTYINWWLLLRKWWLFPIA